MSATLKPCPFCGTHLDGSDLYEDQHGYVVVCPTCFAQTWERGGDTEASAIKLWNRRSKPQPYEIKNL